MKKILISIIVILIIILIGQLIYFRANNKQNDNNIINDTNIINNEFEDRKQLQNTVDIIERMDDVIVPYGIENLSMNYKGNIKLITLEKSLYTFIHTNVKKIYDMTTKKSVNQILQLYDLNKNAINEMNIYSAEDFEGISSQVFNVGNISGVNYQNSTIDMQNSNNDENGYTTFTITFKYSNENELKMKVYFANNSNMIPNIRFGKQD